MPPDPILDEEDYASSEDSDFAPDDAPEREGEAESSEDEEAAEDGGAETTTTTTTQAAPSAGRKRRKQGGGGGDGEEAEDAGFENSGDEAIIEKGRKRRKKGQQAQRDHDDEGGEGGLIKTRSMRAVEKAERKTQVAAGPVTVDVDALWASMTAAPAIPTTHEPQPAAEDVQEGNTEQRGTGAQEPGAEAEPSDMIKIKRTYNFAGKVHTEERLVPRDSAEARLYLASKGAGAGDPGAEGATATADGGGEGEPDRRMPRKAFRSVFEPVVVTADGQRTDLNLGIAMRLQAREKAKKLNTVEKSRMDWAGFVDKEGIKDELVLAGRAKGSYADRQDFLARTEARREDDARRLRLAGKA
ncbi:BCNT-domain-containing protein [Cryphonectria parasitica EP155]|uniref:SWR1-complex protein 5 n=1 Tax=Cryphonectria parasitica (strain ATCC 38755 / EP155) TaxID=660469 RepID=A0A9P5CTX9_CRYP1|nr:BCNT-domain-containing protein [Cryphonectria parasitica EP155]KAF3770162.1 BCNT-domain-containing protein [Cryphonectria parasitica EP155]